MYPDAKIASRPVPKKPRNAKLNSPAGQTFSGIRTGCGAQEDANAPASQSEPLAELIPRQKRNATPGLRSSGRGRTESRELDCGADLLSLGTAHQHG